MPLTAMLMKVIISTDLLTAFPRHFMVIYMMNTAARPILMFQTTAMPPYSYESLRGIPGYQHVISHKLII